MAFLQTWLWFQTAYAIWQFIRVAKYFRVPFALFYTLYQFLFKGGPYPFQKKRVFYIHTGKKWPYGTKLKKGDECHNECYRISRNSTTYALQGDDYRNLHTLDVKKPDIFCTERDFLWKSTYIVNKVEFGEALEAYLKPENTEELLEMKVLLYPSEEINRNFTRLFSIVPLVFQAHNMKTPSIVMSGVIIFIDLLSNMFEKKAWVPSKVKLKNLVKSLLARVKSRSWRSSLSQYFSSISLSLLHTDNFTCNFKRVEPGEIVWIMPNTYLDGFQTHEFASTNILRMSSEVVESRLVEEEHSFIDKHNEGRIADGMEGYFHIPYGSKKYSIQTKQGELKCIFVPKAGQKGMAYNFLDGVELHWGPYYPHNTDMIISFLDLIKDWNYLPFTMSIKGTYKTDGFDRVFSHVGRGGWFMLATANHAGYVS